MVANSIKTILLSEVKKMIKAFLSYTSIDKDLVGLVHQKLTENNAWYDAANIENGDSIPEKINEGLRTATHYILFWSEAASKSSWVKAELNAAFIRSLENKCKFMIFTLDNTALPELLQPYRYDKIDKTNLDVASSTIANVILSQDGSEPRLSEFVNRTQEIGEIEEAARAGYKLIILHGILGIGKTALAEKALQWLYPNRASSRVILDFSCIPGIAELCIELSRKSKEKPLYENSNEEQQKLNIRYFLEVFSASKVLLVLKDVKSWLNEDGSLSDNLKFITDLILSTEMFEGLTIMTSSRYIELPYDYYEATKQMTVRGMSDAHIADIIQNNLSKNFPSVSQKNFDFAKRLYGYPLGAKLSAYRISNHGYDYYLEQPQKIQSLKIGLAKQLISFAGISKDCQNYLSILAISQSRLRNEEYGRAFPDLNDKISTLADEAFFAGILKFDDDGCYKLEPLVEDYYYDLAFNSANKKNICKTLEAFLLNELKSASQDKYLRLLPATIHILALCGNVSRALELHSELTATITKSMWDQYNHTEYEEAFNIAEELLSTNPDNKEALYVKSLCLTRFDEYAQAEEILRRLLKEDEKNSARYYYALGRIQKREGNYQGAIELFETAIFKKARYLSPYREMAECYMHMEDLSNAQKAIVEAKRIDDSNIFVILLDALLLQKQGHADHVIEILSDSSVLEQNPAQVKFRLGRAYDQLRQSDCAKQCYNEALAYNPKMYDAKLCLLNHQIIDCPETAEKNIEILKNKLRGKRRAILTNIEARFTGYVKHNESLALELLESVKTEFRDKQWYAVKIQLLENMAESNNKAGRTILAQKIQEKETSVKKEFVERFGEVSLSEIDLLPDT